MLVYPRECGAALSSNHRYAISSGLSPRVRGSRGLDKFRAYYYDGLSPRVRGSRRRRCKTSARSRSIPASAGQPFCADCPRCLPAVYPRECGAAILPSSNGLPLFWVYPRECGAAILSHSLHRQLRDRSIPASAGQPQKAAISHILTQVYPRECGAASNVVLPSSARVGLSPRVRGSRFLSGSQIGRRRSIPASAGQPIMLCAAA